jgi:hypothetical protein
MLLLKFEPRPFRHIRETVLIIHSSLLHGSVCSTLFCLIILSQLCSIIVKDEIKYVESVMAYFIKHHSTICLEGMR